MRTVTFPSFAGHWSPITAATQLKRSKPLAVMFDDVPVVLFRDRAGVVQALVDRCPHRSVKLSLGKLEDDGTLRCAFHGWAFGGDGRCRHIPLDPDAKLDAVRAQPIAVRELGGLVWVNGVAPDEAGPLVAPPTLTEPGWFGTTVTRDWQAHWSRSIQTMLDVAHIPFVHPKSIGTAFGRALGTGADARLAQDLVPDDDGGFRMDWRLVGRDGAEAGDAGWVAFHPPNGMSLGIPQKQDGRRSLLHIWCVPLTATTSRMIVVSRRNFSRYGVVPALYNLLTPMILKEDRVNIETAWPTALPLSGEVSARSDVSTIAFQRYYRQTFGERQPAAVAADDIRRVAVPAE